MASDIDFVEFVVEQIENAGVITYRKVFGEYALYCKGKVIALICDNRLFVIVKFPDQRSALHNEERGILVLPLKKKLNSFD